jgi:Ca-activated chloride channel homolog
MNFSPLFGASVHAVSFVLIVLLAAALLFYAHTRNTEARKRFGEPQLVRRLFQGTEAWRSRLKHSLQLLALVFALIAFARPQGGSGKRSLIETTLDVVLVIDFSKSMYARDIAPNRIERAKIEVADLVRRLRGARFGAVAFAGEPMSFPLSRDGNAITQFYKQLSPADMPVGGTATAKALERARELLNRDPEAKGHERVILLVTDGEDLEGDPVKVAENCAAEGTKIHVVQIGGSAAEVIPEMDDDGNMVGTRKDSRGKPMTTSLSSEGEAQLKSLAETTGGTLLRSSSGNAGISELSKLIQRTSKAGQRQEVITGRDEWFGLPLALALLCLVIDLLLHDRTRAAGKAASHVG